MSGQINCYQYKYEVVPYREKFLCIVKCNGQLVGDIFEARSHEEMFAWLRLHIGAYPGTAMNDDGNNEGMAA